MSFGKLFVPANKQDAQGYGSALTYARRYSLQTAFGVAPEDDDGNAAAASSRNVHSIIDAPVAKKPAEPKTREKMEGPIETVAALRAIAGKIRDEVRAAEDTDTLDTYLLTMKAEIDQIKRYQPDWWDNKDYGLDGMIASAYRRIEAEMGDAAEPINYVNAG